MTNGTSSDQESNLINERSVDATDFDHYLFAVLENEKLKKALSMNIEVMEKLKALQAWQVVASTSKAFRDLKESSEETIGRLRVVQERLVAQLAAMESHSTKDDSNSFWDDMSTELDEMKAMLERDNQLEAALDAQEAE